LGGNLRLSVNRLIYAIFTGFVLFAAFSSPAFAVEAPGPLFEQASGLSAGQYDMTVHGPTGNVSFLRLKQSARNATSANAVGAWNAEGVARAFFSRYGELFGVQDHASELRVSKLKAGANGNQFVRFRQHRNGVPVFGGDMIVQVDGKMQAVVALGKCSSKRLNSTMPRLSAARAQEIASGFAGKGQKNAHLRLKSSNPELWVYNPALVSNGINKEFLVWRTEMTSPDKADLRELVLKDAIGGRVLLHFNQINAAKFRKVYDDGNTSTDLPGTLVRSEGDLPVSGNDDANYAYDYTGLTYDFYYTMFGRDSVDGAGLNLISTVRYDNNYQNAYWDGSQMVFGTGFASALDVVGHELTHGVTQNESGLIYFMQPGAINESLSDIFGELIQQTYQTVSSDNRWLIGEDLPIGALRSMKDPTAFNVLPSYTYPDRMTSPYYRCLDDLYYFDSSDAGGVHFNSSVGNKAAYLMADGDTFNGKTVTGLGITKTAYIYYEAQTNLLTESSDYAVLYNALQTACSNLIGTYGITAEDCVQVRNVVDAVEMDQTPVTCPTVKAPVCSSGVPIFVFNDGFEKGPGNWTTGALTGSNAWTLADSSSAWWMDYPSSGAKNAYGDDSYASNDSYLAMASSVSIPANAWLHFNHAYDFESDSGGYYDGGVLEYSTNNGASWLDAAALFDSNGYTGAISSDWGNTLAGRMAFAGSRNQYSSSRVNLASLSGWNVRFRFRLGTDSSGYSWGWWIDDVTIYTCNSCAGQPVNIESTYLYYPTIQAGYNAAAKHQSVLMQAADFTEELALTNTSDIKLEGGYSCDFSTNAGFTTVHGTITISGGAVTIGNLIIG